MSERFAVPANVNASKPTRLPVADEFAHYRFGRDALAHVSRYLLMCEWLVQRAEQLGRPLRVLDVGCGDIYLARTLQASFRVTKTDVIERYVGFDIDGKSLDRTATTKPKAFEIDLLQGDVTEGDLLRMLPPKSFDVAVCTEVVEHVQPKYVRPLLAALASLADEVFFSTPNWTGGSGQLPADHVREWPYAELRAELELVGFTVAYPGPVGTFCQLRNVEAAGKRNPRLHEVAEFLRPRLDAHLFSLVMARFLGAGAQNVLHWLVAPEVLPPDAQQALNDQALRLGEFAA
jgi:2-polyprenyl-3-methyl-5-hydroxy-6-metoxy-1,4-benzoquinol methylase